MLKIILRTLLRLFYRVEVSGLEHFKATGKRTLIVANHTSFLDAVLMAVFLPGNFSFAIHTRIVNRWYMKPFKSMVKLFIMDPTNPFSLKSLIQYMKEDNNVVIFPEGRITVTGSLMKIYNGPGLVADRADAQVLPIRIDGAQYTPFSRLRGRIQLRWFPKVTLTILPPRAIKAPAEVRGRARRKYAGQVLSDIMSEMMFATTNYQRTLFQSILDAQRVHGRKHLIVDDIQREPLSYEKLIMRSLILGKALSRDTQKGEAAGILLPNTSNTVVTFLALQAYARVPAMLNFTIGYKGMLSACETARIKTVYTSRRFVDYAKLSEAVDKLAQQVRIIYLEDVVDGQFSKARFSMKGPFKDAVHFATLLSTVDRCPPRRVAACSEPRRHAHSTRPGRRTPRRRVPCAGWPASAAGSGWASCVSRRRRRRRILR